MLNISKIEKSFTIISDHNEVALFTFSLGFLRIRFIKVGLSLKASVHQLIMVRNSILCIDNPLTNDPDILWTLTINEEEVDEFRCLLAQNIYFMTHKSKYPKQD